MKRPKNSTIQLRSIVHEPAANRGYISGYPGKRVKNCYFKGRHLEKEVDSLLTLALFQTGRFFCII